MNVKGEMLGSRLLHWCGLVYGNGKAQTILVENGLKTQSCPPYTVWKHIYNA